MKNVNGFKKGIAAAVASTVLKTAELTSTQFSFIFYQEEVPEALKKMTSEMFKDNPKEVSTTFTIS